MVSKCLPVVLASSLFTSCGTRYQTATPSLSDWAAVVAIPLEERVEAVTTSGRTISGTLKAVDTTHLELAFVD